MRTLSAELRSTSVKRFGQVHQVVALSAVSRPTAGRCVQDELPMDIAPHAMAVDSPIDVYEGGVCVGLAHEVRCSCGAVFEVGLDLGLTADDAQVRARHNWANHAQAS